MESIILLLLITLIIGIFPLSVYLLKTLKSAPKKSTTVLDSEFIHEKKSSAQQWWEDQRSRYNIGLIYAGIIAFGLYLITYFLLFHPLSMLDIQDLFSFLFIAVSYLIYMGAANLFYSLGPIAEAFLKPKKILNFRNRLFNTGYGVSVILPFIALIRTWLNFGII